MCVHHCPLSLLGHFLPGLIIWLAAAGRGVAGLPLSGAPFSSLPTDDRSKHHCFGGDPEYARLGDAAVQLAKWWTPISSIPFLTL